MKGNLFHYEIMTVQDIRNEIDNVASKAKADQAARFFKTSAGEYGERDVFVGLTVPECRQIAKKYKELSCDTVEELLQSPIHEERLIALLILVESFRKVSEAEKTEIYEFYLAHTEYINNWDLVDLSADKIVGEYLQDKPKKILKKLAVSADLWERRIAILSTFAFIKKGECEETLHIAAILLHDKHDLIQKAVGWMLREVGKRCGEAQEEEFLKKHYQTMPRTMLRYAIERFSSEKRQQYLLGTL